MNILIVHAHHEPQSFCSALYRQAEKTLTAAGHTVTVSDLYEMGFDPVSDRHNFTTVHDANYLKQQLEERYATEHNGFSDEIEAEIQKLEQCDALIFCFPLWWFGMPAILKGWCDRVLAMGRVYGGPKLYENGIGQGIKRGLVLMTTGGGPIIYDGWGINPAMQAILTPIQHGIFWFNGFLPLTPFIVWSPVRISDDQRADYLQQLDRRLQSLFEEPPLYLPKMADFPTWQHDTQHRYMVIARRLTPSDGTNTGFTEVDLTLLEQWKQQGILLDVQTAVADTPDWRCFLTLRSPDRSTLDQLLYQFSVSDTLSFEITELSPPTA